MRLLHLIQACILSHQTLAYVVIFFGVLIEGEIFLILAGVSTHIGLFSLMEIIPLILFAAVLKTIFGYQLGVYIRNRFHKNIFVSFIDKKINAFLPRFEEKPFWSIFLSKFIYGINHFTIIFAGYKKIPRPTYFKAEGISSVIWLTLLFSLGYFFSVAAFSVSRDFRNAILIISFCVILFMVLQKLINFFITLGEDYKKNIS